MALPLDPRIRVPQHDDRGILAAASGVAGVLTILLLFVPLPETPSVEVPPQPHRESPRVRRIHIPPPPLERRSPPRAEGRKLPMIDPTPHDPEPIHEPRQELAVVWEPDSPGLPDDVFPPPPPSSPPGVRLLPGVDGVTNPVLRVRVEPEYPPLARVARKEAQVVLRAVVGRDGTVVEIEVARSTAPGLGFEEAALEAVRQWRYDPARQGPRLVEVYLVVVVSFELH